MSSCCCCVNNQRPERLSSSRSLSLHLFVNSVTHSLSLFSLSSLRSLYRSLYLSSLDLGNNGQKNRTCLFLLTLRRRSLLHYHFLSRSLAPWFTCFFLPRFASMSSISFEQGENKADPAQCSRSVLPAQVVRSGFTEVSAAVVVGELKEIRQSSRLRGGGFKRCFPEIDKQNMTAVREPVSLVPACSHVVGVFMFSSLKNLLLASL